MAIVKRKAELLHLDLPEDVAEFIANHLKNNIRQLEGAVKKLNAYYMLEGIQPVISVAQNAIKDILNETQPVPVTDVYKRQAKASPTRGGGIAKQ